MCDNRCMEEILENSRVNVTLEDPYEPPHPPYHPRKTKESLLNWFDRNCEKELQRHRAQMSVSLDSGSGQGPAQGSPPKKLSLSDSKDRMNIHRTVLTSSVSGVDLACRLRGEQDSELLDAVEKLAKAEAMVAFEGAVRAAEEAASSVPPEFAEEAAATSARSFQAQLTEVVKEIVPGVRPVEVVGYVGITRPKLPRKTQL